MPTYIVTTADGQKHRVKTRSEASQEELQAAVSGNNSPPQRSWGDYLGMGLRAVGEGLASAAGVGDIFTGANIAKAINSRLVGQRNAPPTMAERSNASVTGLANRARLPVPVTKNEKRASAVVRGVAATAPTLAFGGPLAANPLSQLAAGGTSALAGDVADEMGAGPIGQFGASMLGGMAGYGASRAMAPKTTVPTPIMAAADRQGVTMLPADVGGTPTRLATAVVRGGTLGEIPIQAGAEKAVNSAAQAVERNANAIGPYGDAAFAGQAAKRGANSFLESSANRAESLYKKIPIAPDQPAITTNTIQALENVTQGLQSNPLLSEIWARNPRLQGTLEALRGKTQQVPTGMLDASGNPITRTVTQGGSLSWEDMKSLRSDVGKIIGQPGLMSEGPDIDKLRALYAGLSSDMEATANASGPKAAQAFSRANQYWRGRQNRIANVFEPILGKKGDKADEAAFRQINTWAQESSGNSKALASSLRSMPKEDAATIQATILARLGKATPGQQNAEGTNFSPSSFVTNWNKLSPRAKSALFPDPQTRANVDDLAMVMDGMKRAGSYANTSKTGLVIGGAQLMAALQNPLVGIPAILGQYGAGALLASPKFARRIATQKIPTTQPPITTGLFGSMMGANSGR